MPSVQLARSLLTGKITLAGQRSQWVLNRTGSSLVHFADVDAH